jgi:hypothetical protein
MRTLSEIAKDIKNDWKNPSIYAVPYLKVMAETHSADPDYKIPPFYMEDAQEQVIRFLCNAQSWRGSKAREIKAELKKQYNIK